MRNMAPSGYSLRLFVVIPTLGRNQSDLNFPLLAHIEIGFPSYHKYAIALPSYFLSILLPGLSRPNIFSH